MGIVVGYQCWDGYQGQGHRGRQTSRGESWDIATMEIRDFGLKAVSSAGIQ